jgi:hypothetical protein
MLTRVLTGKGVLSKDLETNNVENLLGPHSRQPEVRALSKMCSIWECVSWH